MLCDTDKRSVFKYFPTIGKRMKHGDYTVTTEYEDAKSTHVVQRVLNIHIAGRDHKVILLQYTGWPQSGQPKDEARRDFVELAGDGLACAFGG